MYVYMRMNICMRVCVCVCALKIIMSTLFPFINKMTPKLDIHFSFHVFRSICSNKNKNIRIKKICAYYVFLTFLMTCKGKLKKKRLN